MSKQHKTPKSVRVFFPAVGPKNSLAHVDLCSPDAPRGVTKFRGGRNVILLGIEKQCEAFISNVRQWEMLNPTCFPNEHNERLVSGDIDGLEGAGLNGGSYSLALTIADMLARHGHLENLNGLGPVDANRRVVATGILKNAVLEVDRIGAFVQKLECVRNSLQDGILRAGDIFIYPKDNADNPDDHQGENQIGRLLEELRSSGMECKGIDRLEPCTTKPPLPRWCKKHSWLCLTIPLFAVVFAGVGIGFCWLDTCNPLNPPTNTEDSIVDEEKIPVTQPGPISVSINSSPCNSHLCVDFTWGGQDGRKSTLNDGQRLSAGDRLAIQLSAQRDLYVYLWHFDSHHQLRELVSKARGQNRVKAGEKIEFPRADSHYQLNDDAGLERFRIFVSLSSLKQLYEEYKEYLMREQSLSPVQISATTRGMDERLNQYPKLMPSMHESGFKTFSCNDPKRVCRKDFEIQHH